MILVFCYENKCQIWTAHQRTNLNDSTKNTLEEFIFTDWLESDSFLFEKLSIQNLNMVNFYSLYRNFVDVISIHNAADITAKTITGEQARELSKKKEELDAEIQSLKAKAKKETQFNKKVEINLEIKKLETIKNNITEDEL